jgi:hypothetical protein
MSELKPQVSLKVTAYRAFSPRSSLEQVFQGLFGVNKFILVDGRAAASALGQSTAVNSATTNHTLYAQFVVRERHDAARQSRCYTTT